MFEAENLNYDGTMNLNIFQNNLKEKLLCRIEFITFNQFLFIGATGVHSSNVELLVKLLVAVNKALALFF